LRVLFVAVEDEWCADESVGHQLAHVPHGGTVAEGETDFRLELFLPRQRGRAPRIPEVIRDRLLAEHVLAGLERRPRELEMCMAGRADIDHVDVVAREQVTGFGDGDRDIELAGRLSGAIDLGVRNREEATARVAAITGQMCAARPGAGAEDSHSDDVVG
jgi:hypothetical protein